MDDEDEDYGLPNNDYCPPNAVAHAPPDWEILPRRPVVEPKAPALFRARRADGVTITAQIGFGKEPGPIMFIHDGENRVVQFMIPPVEHILFDLRPETWRDLFAAVNDTVERMRKGEKVDDVIETWQKYERS